MSQWSCQICRESITDDRAAPPLPRVCLDPECRAEHERRRATAVAAGKRLPDSWGFTPGTHP